MSYICILIHRYVVALFSSTWELYTSYGTWSLHRLHHQLHVFVYKCINSFVLSRRLRHRIHFHQKTLLPSKMCTLPLNSLGPNLVFTRNWQMSLPSRTIDNLPRRTSILIYTCTRKLSTPAYLKYTCIRLILRVMALYL